MDWHFTLLLFAFAVLIMLGPMYRGSKTFHKNMFYADDVTSMGVVSNIEVFDVNDKEFGHLVGLVFTSTDEDLRLSITQKDALVLADNPVPRLSKIVNRENAARRSRNRTTVCSSQNTSMFVTQPATNTKPPRPLPTTW
jgi:hypothetical protein